MTKHYSNEVVSSMLHFVGMGLAIAVLVVLIVLGAHYGTVWHVVGYSLYGSGLILLYGASFSYHLIPMKRPRLKKIFRKIDHAMIFVLIAATYTPILFITLPSAWKWSLFGVIWGLALVGIVMKFFFFKAPMWISVVLYLLMGWLIVIAFGPLTEVLSDGTRWLLISGGTCYTAGVVFFALDFLLKPRKYFWMHEVVHIFGLGGSTLHAITMFCLL